MGNRYFDEYKPDYVSFHRTWGNKTGLGRWYKHHLSKARRRFGRNLCRFGEAAWRHMGSLPYWEGMVNWKGW
jgi:hypothetical protein